MRLKTNIPAAGERKIVDLTGKSLIIEAAGLYSSADQVPIIKFDNAGGSFPVYPYSTYQTPIAEGFNSLELVGTAESAGDEVRILTFDECLDSNIQPAFSVSASSSVAGSTFAKV
jgi:hypothetical protein